MLKLIIAYDGTHYFGWQKTKAGPSIQEELEKAIWQITRERALPEAASRTDRGVHAEGQVVQFRLTQEWDPQKIKGGLNAVLPKDIRVKAAARQNFHPTLDAIGKEYRYQICLGEAQDPTRRLYSWHCRYPLDGDPIREAASRLVGTHDFTAFANEREKDPICTLQSIEWNGQFFRIQGNRFLYKMVRNLVGTLVYVGCGKIGIESVGEILASKDRKRAGVTAPAHGLYLHQVFYPLK
ncbi:MAG: tRNA pseudouridine(38-40) synthase TruA [Verrucomicrobia bacterium]|nr:tRNA pseudouridine(38-40) synthase TruA [Verrucomicrobiota bacterium]MBU6446855.1 tRNA pseudouridine(38-40) synthase TruA [Verrucomicrobiota bacterium]MDE3047768.1 tRNA pseudouridine(38-40) synthase TruA [Verrucomicrobiota bacterium]